MKQIIFLPILFVLFVTFAFASTNFQQEVSIYPQPDSPLRLLNAVPTWRKSNDIKGEELNMLSVAFVSQNVGDKAIRAYTIRQFEGDFDKDIGATIFSFFPFDNNSLQPNQSLDEHLGESGYRKKPETVVLAVDFVEFTDGTIWGKDLSKSAERFAGVQAGIKAGKDYLQKINNRNGIEAVVKALEEVKEILPPEEQTDKWKTGFKSGLSSIKYGFQQKYEKEGLKGLTLELQKP